MGVEIYFSDLNERGRSKVLEALGIASPDEANLDVFPLFVLEVENE